MIGRESALLIGALSEQSMGIEECKTKGLGSHAESTICVVDKLKRGPLDLDV